MAFSGGLRKVRTQKVSTPSASEAKGGRGMIVNPKAHKVQM
jgi:hypothetical protein